MAPIRFCHCCGSHVRPSSARRHGRIRRRHAADPEAALPADGVVCADCRPDVVDLTRHWTPREPLAGACSFCDRSTAETGLVELASVVGDRVTSRGTYLLCPHCEGVLSTFLRDLRDDARPSLPPAWTTRSPASPVVFARDDPGLSVETTADWSPGRLRLVAGDEAVVEAVTDAGADPVARAREFVAAVEACYPDDDGDLREVATAAVDGHPGLSASSP